MIMHAMHLDRRIAFGMTLPQSILDRIDVTRGATPRVRFLQSLLIKGMGEEGEAESISEQGSEGRGNDD